VYSVSAFGHMVADDVRVGAYAEALRRAIFPGAVVVEIGAGTGFFSMLACQLGAGRVYAIEPNGAIALAEQAAAANGFADRIQFLPQLSTAVELPQKADVLLSDLRCVLPLYTQHIPTVVDARKRLLKPGGVQIPGRDHVFVALVGAAKHYQKELRPWEKETHGFDWGSARNVIVNQWWKAPIELSELASSASRLFTLDYATIESPHAAGTVTLSPTCAGPVYGLAVSFDTELFDGVSFSTAPGQPRTVYSTGFFPFEMPIAVTPSDSIQIDMRADLLGPDYTWSWKTSVNGVRKFSQSTFKGECFVPRLFRQAAANYQPTLRAEALEVRWILENIDGRRTNQELAAALQQQFPGRFSSFRDALNRVVETVGAFC
jgi:type I protein arginine methyltransferase